MDSSLDEAIQIQGRLVASGIHNPFYAFQNLAYVREYLVNARAGEHVLPAPGLLVLALDPEGHALELIEFLRADDYYAGMNILVLADSSQRELLQRARQLGVQADHLRGDDTHALAATIRQLSAETVAPSGSANPASTCKGQSAPDRELVAA